MMPPLVLRRAQPFESRAIVAGLEREHIAQVEELKTRGVTAHLGVLLGLDHMGQPYGPSASYVGRKERYGQTIGARTTVRRVGRLAAERELLCLGRDPDIHGVMVQWPLPRLADEPEDVWRQRTAGILPSIAPKKDVDGLRPRNPQIPFDPEREYAAPTPAAVMRLLRHQTRIPLNEASVTVVGYKGLLVGRHMRPLLEAAGVNLIFEHDIADYASGTPDSEIEASLRMKLALSHIVVTAVGKPGLIVPDMLGKDAKVVIDAGVTRVKTNGKTELLGDLDPSIAEADKDVVFTRPKGGVGPLTVAELWQNTITAARRSIR